MRYAVKSSFDVAVWFMDRASADDAYLQPRMLQALLFVAQGIYTAAHKDALLMPSVFTMDDTGPLEPNLYKVLEYGRPDFAVNAPSPGISTFLDSVWRRFGHFDALRLCQWIKRLSGKLSEDDLGAGRVIGPEEMRALFAESGKKEKPAVKPVPTRNPVERKPAEGVPVTVAKREGVIPPNGEVGAAYRPDGSAVIVKKWVPGSG